MAVGGDHIQNDGEEAGTNGLKFVVAVDVTNSKPAGLIEFYDGTEASKDSSAIAIGDRVSCSEPDAS